MAGQQSWVGLRPGGVQVPLLYASATWAAVQDKAAKGGLVCFEHMHTALWLCATWYGRHLLRHTRCNTTSDVPLHM
jgi:hypothetical protein